ncbi:MAG: hypothetical protein JGK17_18935 [Microcoleus sp. PH2017_10_PVI_O_A]|uniref:hypothetical protein n=1 Tax=unclassified Microcoleus TaxID=2642155 RepID=UPI001D99E3AB|nr:MULTISPECIES: hypothetical protein [unclassified Microcoleus]TAE80444.1 MAG: hypothetical protein EAZ83_18315 [Oscillatoriales cyanobacterium]MCC3407630.1 hypothetical protein [Microcoleus sp. PH2017_10_PVI_O_A]MCC3461809.1 hypothetical protein [Microcoleus sp. PH2017_11_PCY_U_A]MCC3480223.1 hypothetical protein [Microcoleus sp. PH2017_12_PCY_D_A]MCC3526589.1 hypothetical protein [Microcoleus sp. PH2017_21_RUC_O_A]
MAATITGTIKVNVDVAYVTDPKFAGVYTGDFAYDDTHLTKVGEEVLTINDRIIPGLLSLNFRFLDFADGLTPVTYTASDDLNFPDNPVLAFENGVSTQFGFNVFGVNKSGVLDGNNRFMFGDPGIFQFFLRDGAVTGGGLVTLDINESPPAPVPENASPFASLLAFLGLGRVHFWRKSRKGNN